MDARKTKREGSAFSSVTGLVFSILGIGSDQDRENKERKKERKKEGLTQEVSQLLDDRAEKLEQIIEVKKDNLLRLKEENEAHELKIKQLLEELKSSGVSEERIKQTLGSLIVSKNSASSIHVIPELPPSFEIADLDEKKAVLHEENEKLEKYERYLQAGAPDISASISTQEVMRNGSR